MKKALAFPTIVLGITILHAQKTVTALPQRNPSIDINKALIFKEISHDLGIFPYGKQMEYDVSITNVSDEAIKIDSVNVACGCTTPKYLPGPYKPGETFNVNLGFNGKAEGYFEKSANIFFSNGTHQHIKFYGITTFLEKEKSPLKFTEVQHFFGKIKHNIPATYVFTFQNILGKPVIIESATASCGCTTPEYTKGVIAAGATDKIKVTYNAAALGSFSKIVTVKIANIEEPVVLTIEGEVVN